jgi:hypothetical protein
VGKSNREMNFKDSIIEALKCRGYSAFYNEEGENGQIDCRINGTSFAFFYNLTEDRLCFDIIFEPNETINEVECKKFAKDLEEEQTPFSDCMLDEYGCLHLYGEVVNDEYCEGLVNNIVDTIEKRMVLLPKLALPPRSFTSCAPPNRAQKKRSIPQRNKDKGAFRLPIFLLRSLLSKP